MLKMLFNFIISKNEQRLGVKLDYARKIGTADSRLFMRYGKIFGFLDPRKHLSAEAYHASALNARWDTRHRVTLRYYDARRHVKREKCKLDGIGI